MTSHSGDIYTLLVQKSKTVDEFLSATKLLQHALESDDLAAVDRFIKSRGELIPVIDEIDRRISLCRQKEKPDRDPVLVQEVAKMSEYLIDKLKKIKPVDQECNTIAASRCEVLKKEMAALHQNEEGLHVYAGKTQGVPKFLNVRT